MLLRRGLLVLLVLVAALQLCLGDDRDEDCNNKERERGRRGRRGDGERRERVRGERGRVRGERGQRRVPGERRGRGERRRIPGSGRRAIIGSPIRTTSTTSTEAPIVIPHTIIVQDNSRNGNQVNNGHHGNGHHHNAINGNGINGNGYVNGNGNGYANGRPSYLCPAGFVRLGNACYMLSQHIATWQDAHFACRDLGSQLAGLETAWEDKTMRKYLNKPELARLERWIGGIFNWEMKQWIWGSSGKRMGYQGFSRRSPHEDRKWHCVLMDPTRLYRWTHRTCIEQRHYICEAPLHKEIPHKDKNEI